MAIIHFFMCPGYSFSAGHNKIITHSGGFIAILHASFILLIVQFLLASTNTVSTSMV